MKKVLPLTLVSLVCLTGVADCSKTSNYTVTGGGQAVINSCNSVSTDGNQQGNTTCPEDNSTNTEIAASE